MEEVLEFASSYEENLEKLSDAGSDEDAVDDRVVFLSSSQRKVVKALQTNEILVCLVV